MLNVCEIYPTIQGEGSMVGQAVVLVRLWGCNLRCSFCDTPQAFLPRKRQVMSEEAIVEEIRKHKPINWVLLTGGEPLMQDVVPLCRELQRSGYWVAVETNGTYRLPAFCFDHITCSPKEGHEVCDNNDDLVDDWKFVITGEDSFAEIKRIKKKGLWDMSQIYLQPVNNNLEIARLCVRKILKNPDWRLSMQTHKLIQIP